MAHIHDKYDYTASGVIVHEGKTLLIMHKNLGFWTAPSGHVELDETPVEALYKEVEEEAGISHEHLTMVPVADHNLAFKRRADSEGLPLPFDIEVHPVKGNHSHIDLAYLLISDTDNVTPEPGESQEFCWVDATSLRTLDGIPEGARARGLFALDYVKNQTAHQQLAEYA